MAMVLLGQPLWCRRVLTCRGDGVRRGSDGGRYGRSLRVGTAAPASTRAVIVQAATESKTPSGGFGMPSGGRRLLLEAWLEGSGGVGRGWWVFQGGGGWRARAGRRSLLVWFCFCLFLRRIDVQ